MLARLAGCACYGVAASATRRWLVGVSALATATGSQIGATLFLALPAAWSWLVRFPGATVWWALLVLGVLCTGVACILYFRLIASAGPARALTVTFLVPVFAVFYGAVFLGEPVTAWTLACAAVIVCGVAPSTGMLAFGRNPKRRAPG